MTTKAKTPPASAVVTCPRERLLLDRWLDALPARLADVASDDPRCEHGRSVYDVAHDCDGAE